MTLFSRRFNFPQHPQKILYLSSLMLFFWSLYDGIISYVTPIIIQNHGFSNSFVGLIISTSSLAGAVFDFLISKIIRTTHYLRLFLLLFLLCVTYPLLLWGSHTLALFVFAMSLWGLYYDFLNFALFDFSARISGLKQHCQNIGIIGIFKSLGYLLAPLLCAYFISGQIVGFVPFYFSYIFLAVSIFFYLLLFIFSPHHGPAHIQIRHQKPVNFLQELKLWQKIGRVLFPVLIFNVMLYIFEATFWTIGPIYSQQFPGFKDFGGLFMGLFTFPVLFINWFVEPITHKFGKKRTAYIAFFISSLFLIPFGFITNPWYILLFAFISSVTGSLAWPAIHGTYIDYITESKQYENEIVGLKDFTSNLGYIIGPALAGIISDLLGISVTFTFLGLINVVLVIFLLFITPRHIKVVVNDN